MLIDFYPEFANQSFKNWFDKRNIKINDPVDKVVIFKLVLLTHIMWSWERLL